MNVSNIFFTTATLNVPSLPSRARRKEDMFDNITLARFGVYVSPFLEVDAFLRELLFKRINVSLRKHLVPMVRVASIEDGVL